MNARSPLGKALAAGVAVGIAAACSDSYLYDQRRREELPVDRSFEIRGSFCTPGSNEVRRPIKILLAMDASQSMRATDPDGSRARALIELLNTLPQDPEIEISVMLFAGSTSVFLTASNQPRFVRLVDLTDADKTALVSTLLNFTNLNGPNRDSTDFVKALADIYAMLNRDIASSRLNAMGDDAAGRARYSIIFLSDGHPTSDQDDELIRGDAVVRIHQLKDLAEDVRFNTVHVFNPAQPLSSVCDLFSDAGVPGCPLLLINQDAERLEGMARLGGGDFRDFRNNEPINFLNFKFGLTRRAFVIKEWVASNFSAPPGSPLDQADSDSDGLSDADELTAGTNYRDPDTDGDGFSDGVEVRFAKLGATFNPTAPVFPDGGGGDPGCPPNLRGVDTDCDGLLDCDEQLVGSNAQLVDSDRDGIPDGVEWLLSAQASSDDLGEDPDNDAVSTRDELRMHTHPLSPDTQNLTVNGYRYELTTDGGVDGDGRQCFDFRVHNVSLAPTVGDPYDGGVGQGAGFNDLYFSVAFIPSDDPTARTIVRQYRYKQARFPVGGIKSPVDGVIVVRPDELWDRCQPVGAVVPSP